ncbi:MAG TPA: outer membrane beta-barrel domain-containing protein [Polyangia bacterium]|jgi:outer membrane beta-barrel protein
MKRQAACLFVSIAIGLGAGSAVWAAGSKDKADATAAADKGGGDADAPAAGAAGGDAADTGAAVDTSGELDLSDKGEQTTEEGGAAAVKSSSTLTWQDIVVIPRKRFLKGGRFELAPFTGISVNDILIQHYVFGVDLNYFMTDALSVGLQGNYYIKHLTDREADVGLQYDRIPTLNRYLWGAALNFGYVPAYGKFALFNKSILSWEIVASAGVGVTQTEIIPRDVSLSSFQNFALTPNVGIGGRFFLFDWLTVNYMLRDYVILDKFEPLDRTAGNAAMNIAAKDVSAADAKAHADAKLVNNVMFYLGVGVFLPTGFQYKTPR